MKKLMTIILVLIIVGLSVMIILTEDDTNPTLKTEKQLIEMYQQGFPTKEFIMNVLSAKVLMGQTVEKNTIILTNNITLSEADEARFYGSQYYVDLFYSFEENSNYDILCDKFYPAYNKFLKSGGDKNKFRHMTADISYNLNKTPLQKHIVLNSKSCSEVKKRELKQELEALKSKDKSFSEIKLLLINNEIK